MGLFGAKKVRTPREKKPSRRSSGSRDIPGVPVANAWPSLSPVGSMTMLGSSLKDEDILPESPVLEPHDLIPSYLPDTDTQAEEANVQEIPPEDTADIQADSIRVNEATKAAQLYRQSLTEQELGQKSHRRTNSRFSMLKRQDLSQRSHKTAAIHQQVEAALASAERQIERLRNRERMHAGGVVEARHQLVEASSASSVISEDGPLTPEAASEMAGLRRMVEGMRHEMQCLEDELFQLREERAQLDMERAAAADEADAASAALATAEKRQADLVVAVDEAREALRGAAKEKSSALAAALEARDAARMKAAVGEERAARVKEDLERYLAAAKLRASAAEAEASAASARAAEAMAASGRLQEVEVLADEALTALEVKDQELARANAALEGKSADVDRLSVDLKNQTDCVSKLMAEAEIARTTQTELQQRTSEMETKTVELERMQELLQDELKDRTAELRDESLLRQAEQAAKCEALIQMDALREGAAAAAEDKRLADAALTETRSHLLAACAQVEMLKADLQQQAALLQSERENTIQEMEDQRRQLLAQWEVKLNRAQEATEAANAAHTADKEAVELAASRAVAAAADAEQHTADLEKQLGNLRQELSQMEGCISTLHAEAEAREGQLAELSVRAAAAEEECAALKEKLAVSETEAAARAATNAQQAEQLRQQASEVSRLEGGVAALQSRLQQLAEEREGLLGHLNGKAGSLREAEHALAKQQAKQAQQQRQAEDAAQASEKMIREERQRAERAERSVSERQAVQSSWDQQLTHKDAAAAEQVSVLKMQLAAKEAALAQLEMLAITAAESAEQSSALRTDLARKTHQLADQSHQLAHLHDKVEALEREQAECAAAVARKEEEVVDLLQERARDKAAIADSEMASQEQNEAFEREKLARVAAEAERRVAADEARRAYAELQQAAAEQLQQALADASQRENQLRLDAEELNRALKEEVQEMSQAAGAAAQAAAAERSMLQEKLQSSEADLAEAVAKLAAAREESEKRLREHWESTRSEIGKLKVDVETRKKAVAELSKLKADLARNGHVSASEASALRRALAQREEELSRMRRGSAEHHTPA